MFKNKNGNECNICGKKVSELRMKLDGKVSQNDFANLLAQNGLDIDKNAIQRIESGKRFVTDIELKVIAKVLDVDYKTLLDE